MYQCWLSLLYFNYVVYIVAAQAFLLFLSSFLTSEGDDVSV